MRDRHERAVSEVISFVLVFSIITLTVAVVYATGFGGLNDSREAERVNNAERAFDVLADNVEDITQRGAPSRATEVKLADAQIRLSKEQASPTDEETAVVAVNVSNWDADNDGVSASSDSDEDPLRVARVSIDPIVFTANRPSRIVYANGAVLREDRQGATMVREPNPVFRDGSTRTAVLPLVETRSVGSASVGGDTTVLVRTIKRSSTVTSLSDPSGDTAGSSYETRLRIRTTEGRAPVWRDYYNDKVGWGSLPCSVSDSDGDGLDDDVVCAFSTDRLFVSRYAVDVSLS